MGERFATSLTVCCRKLDRLIRRFPAAVAAAHGIGATLDNAHVAEDYLARTTTMYRIIAVGLGLYSEPGMCGQAIKWSGGNW